MGERPRALLWCLLLAVLFVASLYLGRASRPEGAQVALAWPAAGVGVWWLWTAARYRRAAVLASAAVLVVLTTAVNWHTGVPLLGSVLYGVVNLVQALVGVVLLLRLLPSARLRGPGDVLRVLLASVAAGAVSGLLSGVVAWQLFDADLVESLVLFTARNAGTAFVVLVTILSVLTGSAGGRLATRQVGETVLVGLVGAGVFVALFVLPGGLSVLFLGIAVAVWAGSRLPVHASALVCATLGALAVVGTVRGRGAFGVVPEAADQAVLVQAFVALLLLVAQSLATLQQAHAGTQRSLEESRLQLQLASDSAVIGKAIVVRGVDGGWTLTRPNPSLVRLLRRDPSLVRWRELLHPDDSLRLRAVLDRIAGGELVTAETEVRHRVPGEGLVWTQVHLSLMPAGDGTTSVVAQVVDVSARRAAQERLSQLALHDPLTGLANRTHLQEELDRMLTDPRVPGVAVLFLDLDRFKSVNDTLGHEVGDLVLQQVAEALRATLRPDDLVCRLGGDEFVACCPGIAAVADAEAVVARLEQALLPALLVDGRDVGLGVSTGVAVSGSGDDAGSLLRRSDQAMYEVKRATSGTAP